MKSLILLIVVLSISVVSSDLNYPRFVACDPKWGDELLYVSYLDPTMQYTFCHDEESGDTATYLNGKVMTVLADDLNARGVPCGRFGECTPKTLNKLFIENLENTERLENILKFKDFHKINNKTEILDYFNEDYIVVSSLARDNKGYFFLVTKYEDGFVYGIDHEGHDISADINYLWGFLVSKITKEAARNSPLAFLS